MLRRTFWQSQYSDGGFTAEGGRCEQVTNMGSRFAPAQLVETPWGPG